MAWQTSVRIHIWHISDKYIRYIYIFIYICSISPANPWLFFFFSCNRVKDKCMYVCFCETMQWKVSDDISAVRIARYCTSVLISGRTIPVDVTLSPQRLSLVHVRASPRLVAKRDLCPPEGGGRPTMNQRCRESIFYFTFSFVIRLTACSINTNIAPWQLKPVGAKKW